MPAFWTVLTLAGVAVLIWLRSDAMEFFWALLLFCWLGSGVVSAWQAFEWDDDVIERNITVGVHKTRKSSKQQADLDYAKFHELCSKVRHFDYFGLHCGIMAICFTIVHVAPLLELSIGYYRTAL